MWKLDRELAFIFWLRRLVRVVRFAESKAPLFAGGSANVTDSADRRAASHHRLARKKLPSMTAHTGVMVGKIRYVGKVPLRGPGGRNFVTIVAGEALVLFGRVKKGGVLCG